MTLVLLPLSWMVAWVLAAAAPAAAASPQGETVDDIFLDHPSMNKNATVMPAPGARPVGAVFKERAILDASVTRAANGAWFLTGELKRDGPKDGVRLWTSHDGRNWRALGAVHAPGRRLHTPEVLARDGELYLTFADENGCARIAAGAVAAPRGPYRESGCLVEDAAYPSLFVDDDGAGYLLWAGGRIAKLAPGFGELAERPRFLKPNPEEFAPGFPEGQDWPVRARVGETGAAMFKDHGRYLLVATENTGRLRAPTEDVFMAEAPTPYGPFSRRFLAVPHAGRTSVLRGADGALHASYNPECADRFALFCEQVGLMRLERAPDGRLRQAASVLTENSAVAGRAPVSPAIPIRDPSVTLGGDGTYYLVGTTGENDEAAGELALWRSPNLERWEKLRLRFDRAGLGRRFRNTVELWAPEIKWVARDRTYYLAFSMMERDVGGKTWLYRSISGEAEGPYRNVAKSNLVEGIDGFVFEDGDGDGLYLLWGGGNLGKLNARRDGFEGPVRRLVDTDGAHIGYEGNALIKVDGVYFVTGAEWNGPLRTHGTYDMMYGASRSLFGPYAKRRLGMPHAGHGTPFRDGKGRYWTTMFGNDVTAPWRKRFGLVPIEIGDDRAIGAPGSGKDRVQDAAMPQPAPRS